MSNYEIVLILQPDLDEAVISTALDKVAGWIKDGGGIVTKNETWGKRRMAYSIRKQRDGYYVLLTTQMPPSFTIELERNLRLLESVMRFMITSAE
jgi:small subunit ribosomal protein S6